MGTIIFVLGGIRSGKSRFAEELAASWQQETGGAVTYVATSRVRDAEMKSRVSLHRSRRPSTWRTVESPVDVADALGADVEAESFALLDCVNMFVSNILLDADEHDVVDNRNTVMQSALGAVDRMIAALVARPGPAVLISNEVGMAPVALTPLGRLFQDTIGFAHQRVAAASRDVYFLVAGIPQKIK